ncbi:MAG: flagellar hook-basal body complex protein FliE [Terracidiphilus sp.]|jgi:flagellar hook-basal body complex protein FliE
MSNVTLGGIPNSYLPQPTGLDAADNSEGLNFGAVLKNAVQSVDQMNNSAGAQVSNLLQGGSGDMTGVMIAVEKADVSFQLMMQVRNKIVNAYQDIEKMQF